jgi:hypothetical protein
MEEIQSGNWDSSVNVVTRQRDESQTNHGSIFGKGKIFFFFTYVCRVAVVPTQVPILSVFWVQSALSCVATTPCLLMGGCLGTPWRRVHLENELIGSYARTCHISRDPNIHYCVHTNPAISPSREPD